MTNSDTRFSFAADDGSCPLALHKLLPHSSDGFDTKENKTLLWFGGHLGNSEREPQPGKYLLAIHLRLSVGSDGSKAGRGTFYC